VEGTPFGRYRLIELLGRGGMGEVWRAYDTETQRVVAVKVLPANLANDPIFEQRFRREALAAAGLTDPHVVPIHNFGEIDGRLYVDMRLISGRDLQAIIKDGVLEPQRAVAIVEQIASALRDAHRIGLVHRDVKPSNILVTENDFAYLIDFGIARAAGESTITGTGNVIGTWAYMAPERLSDGKTDPRGDTYSLACVLHECLTGSQPFPGKSIEQQIGGHLGLPPPRPSAVRSDLPPQLDNVIATGMAKNPDQRYPTVVEMAAAARAALTATTVLPRPPETDQFATRMAPPTGDPQNYYQPPTDYYQPPTDYYQPTGGDSPGTAATLHRPYGPTPGHSGPLAGQGSYGPIGPGQIAPQPQSNRGRIVAISSAVAVLAVIGIVVAIVMSGRDGSGGSNTTRSNATPSAQPNTGPFTGTYSAALGPRLNLVGKDLQGGQPAGDETWNLRSVCAGSTCTATASRKSGTFAHPAELVFDQIGDRWIAVALGTAKCKNRDAEEWNYIWLKQRPDGSLAGEWISDAIDCYSKRALTFTRNGDANVASLTDPGTLSRRVVSPAQALHGAYHSKFTITSRTVKMADEDFSVDTICLRAGDRCLSRFVVVDGTARYQLFIFANGAWTRNSEYDTPCPAGGTSHVKLSGVFPLPNPPQDPISQLSGHGFKDDSGSTCVGGTYDQVFTRTGD
jgi:serine/threonine protein kinase